MLCPRTGTPLKEIEIAGVRLDLSEACGGVWFDNFELSKFDEAHESAGEELLSLMEEHLSKDIDFQKRLHCPRHPDMIMMRRYFSPRREIEIDECPKCAGIWLDAGELAKIRRLFPREEDRKRSVAALIDEMFKSEEFKAFAEESEGSRLRAQRFANFFKWICPSAYIPGKQSWGAF